MTDTEREAHISDCGRLMQAAMQRYAESSDLADLGDAHRWRIWRKQLEGRAYGAYFGEPPLTR